MIFSEITKKMIDCSNGNRHDIACPLCREKYGNTNGTYQEQEGSALAGAAERCKNRPLFLLVALKLLYDMEA